MPHLIPPPQREAVGSTAGRPHLLSGSGEVPLSPLCSTPLRDPPEIRDTLGGGPAVALRAARTPRGQPQRVLRAPSALQWTPFTPPGPAGGVGPSLLLQPRSVGRSAQPKAARHEAAPNAAHCRPPPAAAVPAALIAPSSSPYPPPPSPAVSPRHSPVPLPPTRCATHFRPPPLRTRLEPMQLEANLTFLLPHISLTQVLNYHCPREMSA